MRRRLVRPSVSRFLTPEQKVRIRPFLPAEAPPPASGVNASRQTCTGSRRIDGGGGVWVVLKRRSSDRLQAKIETRRYLVIGGGHTRRCQKQIALITAQVKCPVRRANRIKQSIDRAPPPRVSDQSICVYQPIGLHIFCCLQAAAPSSSSLLFSSLLVHVCLVIHQPIYLIMLPNHPFTLPSVCQTIS